MGKFRSKLKGQTKGKRWPKGQSSSSNPETRKYRDQAKSKFFTPNIGNSNLTSEALLRHNALQSYVPSTGKEESTEMESEIDDSSTFSSYKTMQSFASEWSECSNMSYSRFLKVFRSDSALHKEMLAILAAITEIIKEQGGTESPTEYYCSLLTTLEQIYNTEVRNEDQLTAVLSLLNMGIKTVPEGVLRTSFSDVTKKMLHILNDYVNSDNNTIIKSIFGILAALLRAQEPAIWNDSSTNQIFQCLLNPFAIHTKPKWRKASQQAIVSVIKADYFEQTSNNAAADQVAIFCEQTLETCMGGSNGNVLVSSVQAGQTTILHTLGLMRETICHYSKTHIKRSGEIILRLMALNYPLVTSCGLQVLHSLFSAQKATVTAKLNVQLISALYEYQPSVADVQPTLAWLAVMQQAHIHLSDVDMALSVTILPKIVTTVTQLWLSEKVEVVTGATHALELLLRDAISPICSNDELVAQNKTKLEKCFNAIQLGLGYQYNTVWHQVLHVIGVMFEVAGRTCSDLLLATLKCLAELRDSYKFSYNNELEHAVGAAVRTMGPEIVLNVIPLKKENGDLNIDRSWLLPVLKENIKQSTINYFVNGILPLALFCQRKSAQQAQENDGIGSHSSELFYLQLWNLLPCFCTSPTDIKDNFKTIAKVLGMAITDKKELRLAVMASLRKLISYAKDDENNKEDLNELSRFDKNYLPILFNLYTTKPLGSDEEGQRLAALDTIKLFLSIAKPELHQQLFSHAIERLNSSSEDPEDSFIKESILDLIRALVSYQNAANVKLLYDQCIKSLPDIKNNKEQKKAYRLLEEICSSSSEGCLKFLKNNRKEVQKLLMKSLNTAAVSSKGARLRCLNYLVKAQPHLDHDSRLIRSIIPEAMLCCKDINVKCRSIAYEVLNTIGETLMKHNQMQQFVELLLAGFTGTPQLISCTILGLASVLHNFSGALGQENIRLILENIATLTRASTREIVGSCLSFLKVYCTTLPSPVVASSLPIIIQALTTMTEDCKRHFRLKTRDILDRLVRKYGCELITPHIPANDTVMYKRLRNLRKLNTRKKKRREEMKENQNDDEDFAVKTKPKSVEEILADSDSDEIENEMEIDEPKYKNKTKTWIEENEDTIVDFTDPNVSSKITATRPGQNIQQINVKKEKDRGFKTAADGRLIITDNDSSDSDNNDKKKNQLFDTNDSDSDNDDASIAETLLLTDRKRKRSTSSSIKSGFSSSSTQPPMKYKTGGVGIHRSTTPGTEFKSKKAAGDVKRKGKHDPYAYLPLQRSALNRRKKSKLGTQFKTIIKAAKSGALKGAKAKKKK